MGMMEKMLRPFFGKKKYYGFWLKVYKAALMGMNVGNGGDFEESGEKHALLYVRDHVVSGENPVLFDVGANVGNYARVLSEYFKGGCIHCFEPAKKTFETLSANVKSLNVILNNFGASDEASEQILYSDSDNSGLASLYDRQCVDNTSTETVRLETIDNYCAERKIPYIHFLKMDIEGNELNALNGAKRMLEAGNIGAIQIEFGGCNIDSRTYFRDFWNLLHENYKIYRVLLDGLAEVKEYGDILEIFFCTNYLFVSKNAAKG